jgi:hypothetical protein
VVLCSTAAVRRTARGARRALRRLLAPLIFRRCGENFKCFQHVEFSFGYNMEVGDDVVVHRHVLLDDRGGIVLGDRVSISDYANVYSHTHSIVEQSDVTNVTTVLGDGVRVTYHATVPRGRARRRPGDGRRDGGRDEGRAPVPRERRHPGEEHHVKPNAPPQAYVLPAAREQQRRG